MGLSNIKWKIKTTGRIITKGIGTVLHSETEKRNRRYYRYYRRGRVEEKTILYEAFYGRGMLCGPLALFNELVSNPDYADYRHVWVLDKLEDHTELMERTRKRYDHVTFVEYGSNEYLKYLACAKYLINNSTFMGYFIKKPEQVYINTWHGIPLKTLCHDEPGGALGSFNMTRNMLHADYVISANPFLTDVYLDAFKMRGLSNAKIIEEGYPRLDTLVNTPKEEVYEELRRSGVKVDPDKKIILYAPTWKGASFGKPDVSVDGFEELKKRLDEMIDTDKYQVLVKVHQVVYSHIKEQLAKYDYVVPATMDANVILGVTDILISDYSSIYFDYLATGRPVLFYITDAESYKKNRGMYFGLDSLPGPYTDSLEVLGDWINHVDDVFAENKDRYRKVRDWCCDYPIGSISKKIVEAVFHGSWDGVKAVSCCGDGRKKVLISRGPMLVNGIGSAALNLLKQFDYDKYDVTVMVDEPDDNLQREQIRKIDPRARVVVRQRMYLKTAFGGMRNKFYLQCGPRSAFWRAVYPKKVYATEFRRIYADCAFDYIVDYEGYNIFYSTLCLAQPEARRCIWMHNDMMSEYEVRFKWLKRIFALYPMYDRIVACGKQIMEVNRDRFSDRLPADKFYYAKNCIDFERVAEGSRTGIVAESDGRSYYAVVDENAHPVNVRMIPLQPESQNTVNVIGAQFGERADKVENGCVRFASVARLSPEKNQEELIQAFAMLAGEYDNVMLYIIGQGPLRRKLLGKINTLGLSGRVVLTGNVMNPFGLLRQCDCFILPSIHEGQPLVVLEARELHMPVILSRFSTVEGSVMENGQYMTDMDAASIYEGMKAYMEGRVPCDYHFDSALYNREAYGEFEAAVFGD